jgi:DnaJ-class molecular chaperone
LANKDFYKILNVSNKASLKEIKSAFRQLALKFHPDHNPGDSEALKTFNLIKEAYETLSSPDLRKKYDFSYTPSSAPTPGEVRAEPRKTSETGREKKGRNLRYNLFITLEDVVTGCERSIRYIRKSRGEPETVQLKVRVPKGAYHHQRLKLTGYGDMSDSGPGDLFVIIHLQNHPIFIRRENDLRVNVPITYADAALGARISFPTLTGIKSLKLKACEFEDLEFHLKGQGLPDHDGKTRGELHVHCFIEHPKKMNPEQVNAMQKLRRSWPEGEMMQQYQTYLKQAKGSSQ